jgi:hypothetical protein
MDKDKSFPKINTKYDSNTNQYYFSVKDITKKFSFDNLSKIITDEYEPDIDYVYLKEEIILHLQRISTFCICLDVPMNMQTITAN